MPALMPVTKSISAKGPRFLLATQEFSTNITFYHLINYFFNRFFFSLIAIGRRHVSLSSPPHALAPRAEYSCPVPIITDVSHMGHICMKVLLPKLPRSSVWLLSPPLLKQRSGSVALAKDTLQFLSQVRPLTWSKLLNHGRTCLPQPGSRAVTEESRQTALLDLRESWSQLFEAAARKAEAMLRETHFAHTPCFPGHPVHFTALQWTAA